MSGSRTISYCRREAADDGTPIGIGQRNLNGKTERYHAQQSNNERLDPAESEIL